MSWVNNEKVHMCFIKTKSALKFQLINQEARSDKFSVSYSQFTDSEGKMFYNQIVIRTFASFKDFWLAYIRERR